MKSYTGMSFEEAFGLGCEKKTTPGIIQHKKNVVQKGIANAHQHRVRLQKMSEIQRRWFKDMFPKAQDRQELICYLICEGGHAALKSLRHIDFAPLKKYWSVRNGSELVDVEGAMPIRASWEAISGYEGEGFYQFTWRFTNSDQSNPCQICVEQSGMRKITARELVDRIKKRFKEAGDWALDQLNQDDETIQNELTNADDKVFVYELLQNANDYPFDGRKVKVEIRLDHDCLCFRHTGREFSPLNVDALCSAGAGDKSDNPNAIGYKGIGFKTVFRNNSRVYVKSGPYSFWFDRERAKHDVRLDAPWRRIPLWEDNQPSDMGEFRVGFKLFPDKPELLNGDNENGYAAILEKMFETERVLLFIPEISEVHVKLPGKPEHIVTKESGKWCVSSLEPVVLPDEIKDEIDRQVEAKNIPQKMKGKEKTKVTFACGVDGNRLQPVENACLYCFLPAEHARWGFRFLMNTDMVPTGPRDDVRPDLLLNRQLARLAGVEFCKWINSLLSCGKYACDSVFDLIPDFEACIKNAAIPSVKEFLGEFRQGVESYLPTLNVPDCNGDLMPISEVWSDAIGVVDGLGVSFWEKLSCVERTVHHSLLKSPAFRTFVGRYREKLKLKVFGWNELRAQCAEEELQKWLRNPNANDSFVSFLHSKGVLGDFANLSIFLDNRGDLGRACDMYPYGEGIKDVERYLPKFIQYARYLSPKVQYSSWCAQVVKFKVFGPRTFMHHGMLSQTELENTKSALKDFAASKGFWGFVAKYRIWDGKERFAADYDLLGSLPVITEVEGGAEEVVDSILNSEFSVYVRDEHSDAKILQYKWFTSRVRYISCRYFEGEDGHAIKEMLTSPLFAKQKRLIGKVELVDVSIYVFNRFKDAILADARTGKSDLGVYAFLSDCFATDPVNYKKWIEDHICSWPVEGINGFTERKGCSLWYFNKELIDIVGRPWFDSARIIVLAEKYLEQKGLFDILGAKDFENVGFGEFFREEISIHLNKECDDWDVVAFHEYMRKQLDAEKIVSGEQLKALKRTPVLVLTKDGICRPEGCEGVLIVEKQIDVSIEVSEGRLPGSVKMLDPRLLAGAGMFEYWKRLGCQELDEGVILEKMIAACLEGQSMVRDGAALEDELQTRHVKFVNLMYRRDVDAALLRGVKLIDGTGVLANPEELVLGEKYLPTCAFQRYGCNMRYVSECYCGEIEPEAMAIFLRSLGVRDDFGANDVSLLTDNNFCKYYWTEYCRMHAPDEEIIKAMRSAPCVLDRSAAEVRKPCEFYSLKIEHPYVDKIGAKEKLPLREGVSAEVYDKLGLKESLTGGDAVSFLLADKAGNEYKYRGRALGWIASGTLSPEDAERYRSSEDAVWKNAKDGRMTHVRDLCVIGSKDANRVRSLFGNSEFVIDLRGIHDSEDHIGKADVEKGLERLGVVVVRNSSLKPLPKGDRKDTHISDEVKVRLLMLLASSSEDGWEDAYDQKALIIDACHFYLCDSFEETCETFDKLKSSHGTYSEKDDKVFYVGGWQNKRVYLDVVKFLKKKLNLNEYMDEDLKDIFDTDGGMQGLAMRIIDNYRVLLDDVIFKGKVEKVCPALLEAIDTKLKLRERERLDSERIDSYGASAETECSKIHEEKDLGGCQNAESSGEITTESGNNVDAPEPKKYSDDEEIQMRRVFRNDLTVEEMNDLNRLDCLRLFNSLTAQGYQPKMVLARDDVQVQKTYEGLTSEQLEKEFINDAYAERRFAHSATIETNDGRQIHVVGAINGVAHLPPKWWMRVALQEDAENVKFVVCAIVSHRDDGFHYIRTKDDLKLAIGANFTVVRVQSEDSEARFAKTLDLFKSIPERSDYSTYSLLLLHSMKADKSYENVFHILEGADDGKAADYRG